MRIELWLGLAARDCRLCDCRLHLMRMHDVTFMNLDGADGMHCYSYVLVV